MAPRSKGKELANFSQIDLTTTPPTVTVPRSYNAAVDFIERHGARGNADRTALIDDLGSYSYGDLEVRMNRAGNLLTGLGLAAEQRVVMCMLDGVDFVSVFFGALKAGLVAVPVNTLLTTEDYEYILSDSRAPVLVVSAELLEKFTPIIGRLPVLRHVIVAGGKSASHLSLEELAAAADTTLEAADTSADDVGLWLYSSGSTGRPKGAAHLHSDLVYTVRVLRSTRATVRQRTSRATRGWAPGPLRGDLRPNDSRVPPEARSGCAALARGRARKSRSPDHSI